MEQFYFLQKNFILFHINLVHDLHSKAKSTGETRKIYNQEWDMNNEEFSAFFHIDINSDYLAGYALQISTWGYIKSYSVDLEKITILNDPEMMAWLTQNANTYPRFTTYVHGLESLRLAINHNYTTVINKNYLG